MEDRNSTVLIRPNQPQTNEQLNSWKEIATYLKREVRTVRRWETYEALPVHRHLHNTRGSVYAFKTEIDSWWTDRCTKPRSSSIVLAVLPFKNLNGKREQGLLGDGLSAEVATQLVRLNLAKLCVTDCSTLPSKNSTERIDKIPEQLGATHVIGGTIRSEQDHSLITAYLLRANGGTYVWAESYRSKRADDIVAHGKVAWLIAQSVVAKLLPRVTVAPPRMLADSLGVHKFYAEGRSCWNKRTPDGLVNAIAWFDQAIRQDPTYAPAYAGLADSYLQLAFYGILPVVPAMKKAKAAALKAVELDNASGEAHTSLTERHEVL